MKHILALLITLLITSLMGDFADAQSTYRIKPGDVVRVEVLEDNSINRDSLVLPDGTIVLPLAGSIQAGGRTVEQVRSEVSQKLAPNFASEPTVFVSISQIAARTQRRVAPPPAPITDTVYVLGEVNKPGLIELKTGSTLLQALAAVGGFSKFAATKRIQLRRNEQSRGEKIYQINYNAILTGRSDIGSIVLKSGDVIIVPQRKLFE